MINTSPVFAKFEDRFSGTIPAEIFELPQLKRLWLYDNRLSGTLPNDFSRLPFLEDIDFAANRISGTLHPEMFATLPNLRHLRLERLRISGTLPSEIALLTNLDTFVINANLISGSVPSELTTSAYDDDATENDGFAPEVCFLTNEQCIAFENHWDDNKRCHTKPKEIRALPTSNPFRAHTKRFEPNSNLFTCPLPSLSSVCGQGLECESASSQSLGGSHAALPSPAELAQQTPHLETPLSVGTVAAGGSAAAALVLFALVRLRGRSRLAVRRRAQRMEGDAQADEI